MRFHSINPNPRRGSIPRTTLNRSPQCPAPSPNSYRSRPPAMNGSLKPPCVKQGIPSRSSGQAGRVARFPRPPLMTWKPLLPTSRGGLPGRTAIDAASSRRGGGKAPKKGISGQIKSGHGRFYTVKVCSAVKLASVCPEAQTSKAATFQYVVAGRERFTVGLVPW